MGKTTFHYGAHNAGTGEPPANFLSRLLTPFARCQHRTIRQLAKERCRVYDLRVRKHGFTFDIAHGLWRSSTTLNEALYHIAQLTPAAYVEITYEGRLNAASESAFVEDMTQAVNFANMLHKAHVRIININVKCPKWRTLATCNPLPYHQCFMPITGLRALLPIPILWYHIYHIWHQMPPEHPKDSIPLYDFV